jgi:hypothetical protein
VPSLLVETGLRIGINSWAGLLALQLPQPLLVLVPAVLMGMIMPLVLTWASGAADLAWRTSTPKRVGQSYALNTLGAIAGAIGTAFVLIPMTTRVSRFCAWRRYRSSSRELREPRRPPGSRSGAQFGNWRFSDPVVVFSSGRA